MSRMCCVGIGQSAIDDANANHRRPEICKSSTTTTTTTKAAAAVERSKSRARRTRTIGSAANKRGFDERTTARVMNGTVEDARGGLSDRRGKFRENVIDFERVFRAGNGRSSTTNRTRTRSLQAQAAAHAIGVNELAWLASTTYSLFCFYVCIRAKRGCERAMYGIRNYSILVPLSVFYGVLLLRSWNENTLSLMMPGSIEEGLRTGKVQFIPRLQGISALLSERAVSASAWAHFMSVNLFVARHATLQSITFDFPVSHTLALCIVTGPLGLLSHVLTKSCVLFFRKRSQSTHARNQNSAQ